MIVHLSIQNLIPSFLIHTSTEKRLHRHSRYICKLFFILFLYEICILKKLSTHLWHTLCTILTKEVHRYTKEIAYIIYNYIHTKNLKPEFCLIWWRDLLCPAFNMVNFILHTSPSNFFNISMHYFNTFCLKYIVVVGMSILSYYFSIIHKFIWEMLE